MSDHRDHNRDSDRDRNPDADADGEAQPDSEHSGRRDGESHPGGDAPANGHTDAGEFDMGVQISSGLAAKLAMAAFGFAGTVIFARVLGPSSFGGFYLLVAIVRLVDRPVNGYANAVKKRFSEAHFDRPEAAGSQLLFTAAVFAVASAGAVAAGPLLAGYTGLSDAPVLFVVLFGCITLFYPFQNMLAAVGRIGIQMWIVTARSVLTFVAQLGFVLAGFGAAGMVFGLSLGTVLAMPLTHYFLRVWPAWPSVETLRSVWSFAKYSIVTAFIGRAYDRFDVFLIGAVLSPAVVGHYEVAYKLTSPATFITAAAASSVVVKVSNLDSRGRDYREPVARALAFSSLLAVPLLFGALALPRALVRTIYGPSYLPAAALVVGIAAYQLVRTQSAIFQRTLAGMDRPEVNTAFGALTLAFNVVAGLALVYPYGAAGVVVATLLAETMRYLASAGVVRRQVRVPLVPRFLVSQVVAGVTMFGVVRGVVLAVPVTSATRLAVVVGTGGVVYGAVLAAVSPQFRTTGRHVGGQLLATGARRLRSAPP